MAVALFDWTYPNEDTLAAIMAVVNLQVLFYFRIERVVSHDQESSNGK
jgi:hypothetical protein